MAFDSVDHNWLKWNMGGTQIGRWKIYCLKFADDVAIVAEDVLGLQAMIKDFERYVDNSNGGASKRAKTAKVVNKVWGITKRAGLQDSACIENLFDLLILPVAAYGVELWGLRQHEEHTGLYLEDKVWTPYKKLILKN
uniref:Uncharacterized protein n=1 Tax=Strigamia maritima TaxID=126957 RepID=T1J264_STRMM